MRKPTTMHCFFLVLALAFFTYACDDGDSNTQTLGDEDVTQEQEEVTESEEEILPYSYSDSSFFHEVREPAATRADATFDHEETTYYRTNENLPDLDIRALAYIDGTLYAGSASGILRFLPEEDRFEKIDTQTDSQPVTALSRKLTQAGDLVAVFEGTQGATTRDEPPVDGDDDSAEWTEEEIEAEAEMTEDAENTEISDSEPSKTWNIVLWNTSTQALESYEWIGEEVFAVTVGTATFWPGSVRDAVETIWLGTSNGVWALENDAFVQVAFEGENINDLMVDGNLIAGTDNGVQIYNGTDTTEYTKENETLSDNRARVLGFGGTGAKMDLWVACSYGLNLPEENFQFGAEFGKLPSRFATDMDVQGNEILLGHQYGATYLRFSPSDRALEHKDFYISRRWVLDNYVNAVAFGADGSRWFGTSKGITRIDLVKRTLEDKMEIIEDILDRDFWRMDGFVSSDGYREDPWDTTSPAVLHDKDNDGLWTQMMIGGWAYAYGATGDEKYCEKARKAMGNMLLQIDVPGEDFKKTDLGYGFITRSLVRDDEGDVYTDKSERDNWHPVTYEGVNYYWKDDTSSDEIDGHFYGFPLYYDFCANEENGEKQNVADHAGALADYILRHGFLLLDLDGEKTMHGHFAPEYLAIAVDGLDACVNGDLDRIEACGDAAFGGGWLNSMEILGLLLSSYHMTGEKKFYDAYELLIREHRYDEVVLGVYNAYTVTTPGIKNHSDHELAMLAYATLIRYEPNDERRDLWIDSLKFFYEYEKPERNPLWAAIVSLAAGSELVGETEIDGAIRTLREMPMDNRKWYFDNLKRTDVKTQDSKDRFDEEQLTEVLPYDEMRAFWWNGNPYSAIEGGDGKGLQGPMCWLLPYWGLRYANILE